MIDDAAYKAIDTDIRVAIVRCEIEIAYNKCTALLPAEEVARCEEQAVKYQKVLIALEFTRSLGKTLFDVKGNWSMMEQQTVSLSERENAIVDLIRRGFSNRQIADKLNIGRWSVRDHIKNINYKLGLNAPQAGKSTYGRRSTYE